MPTCHFAHPWARTAALLAVLFVGTHITTNLPPAAAESAVPGSVVEIDEFFYSFYLGGDDWELECRYRIDGGEWRTARAAGEGSERQLKLPGTSVEGNASGYLVDWTCGEDVARMWIGARRVR